MYYKISFEELSKSRDSKMFSHTRQAFELQGCGDSIMEDSFGVERSS